MVKEMNYDERLSEIKEYVKKCSVMGTRSSIPESDAAEISLPVGEIATRVEQITLRENDLKDAAKRVSVFEADHDVSKYDKLESPEESVITLEDLEDALAKSEQAIKDDEKLMDACKKELAEAEEIFTAMDNAREEFEGRDEALKALKIRYETVSKTREYLATARDNFNTRYIKDIQAAFDKYYKMLTGSDEKKYTIDANLNVTYLEQGQPRIPDTLSEGYKDLVGLCRRVAMADAMYTSEKPCLILDDPFVNLDDAKLKGAADFIKALSDEYQVVYFTCQQARKF